MAVSLIRLNQRLFPRTTAFGRRPKRDAEGLVALQRVT